MNKGLLRRFGVTEKDFKKMFVLLGGSNHPKSVLIALRKAALLKRSKRGVEL